MDDVPDIDELLDQLEANEVATNGIVTHDDAQPQQQTALSEQEISSVTLASVSKVSSLTQPETTDTQELTNGTAVSPSGSENGFAESPPQSVVSDLIKLDESESHMTPFKHAIRDEPHSNIDDLLSLDLFGPAPIEEPFSNGLIEHGQGDSSVSSATPTLDNQSIVNEPDNDESVSTASEVSPPARSSSEPPELSSSSSSEYYSVLESFSLSPEPTETKPEPSPSPETQNAEDLSVITAESFVSESEESQIETAIELRPESPVLEIEETVDPELVYGDEDQIQGFAQQSVVRSDAEEAQEAIDADNNDLPYFEIQLEALPPDDDDYATLTVGDADPTEQSAQVLEGADLAPGRPPTPPPPPRSLIASEHEATDARDMKLTRSEMQLGKIKPYWIPDPDSPCCLLCTKKFTVLRRRHHCRSCGRVLCRECCNTKAKLPYMDGRESKVCQPCSRTLERIEEIETKKDEQTEENVQTSTAEEPTAAAKEEEVQVSGVLKRADSSQPEDDGAGPSTSVHKSVTFSDGIKPGSGQEGGGSPMLKPKKKKHNSNLRMGQRVAVLRMTQELECFLPGRSETEPKWPLVFADGTRHQVSSDEWVQTTLETDGVLFAIKRNLNAFVKILKLDCCYKKDVWYFASRGLDLVAANEVVVIVEKIPDETTVPLDVLYLFNHLYDQALKGRRPKDLDCTLYYFNSVSGPAQILASPDHAGFLFFRPTLQCLQSLPLPSGAYLVAVLVHRLEVPWAMVLPFRLLLRLGLEFGFYPCPLVSQRFRQSVFREVGQTMMSVFVDFRNYSYSLPQIYGSIVSLKQSRACISLPKSKHEQFLKILGEKSQPQLMAWATTFNTEADSHLICSQNEAGMYKTQAFNIEGKERTITGASFVILNGVLKSGSQAQCTMIEDGVMVRMRPEAMEQLLTNLKAGKDDLLKAGDDFEIQFQWTADSEVCPLGAARSAVDGRPLKGSESISISQDSLGALCVSGSQYSLRMNKLVLLHTDSTRPVAQWLGQLWDFGKQVEAPIATSLVPFIELLVASDVRCVSLRLNLGPDVAEYEVGTWSPALEQERAVWLSTLDDQLIQLLFPQGMQQGFTATFELSFSIVDLS